MAAAGTFSPDYHQSFLEPAAAQFGVRVRECSRHGGVISGISPWLSDTHLETRMTKFAIRLLTLALFAVALSAVPMITTAANAATDSTAAKKKHKRMHPVADQTQAPARAQYPVNMSDDPARKTSY
jgi:hypothetical protein